MKKLIFVFIALFILVLISGCNARNNKTVRFNENSADITSDVTSIDVDSEDIDIKNAEVSTDAKDIIDIPKAIKKSSNKLEVLSFDGGFLKTNLNYNIVQGSTSSDTHVIKINDYKLQKYVSGSNEWSYIASIDHGTMKEGWNNYVVKTFDKSDKQISSLMFSIEHEAPVIPEILPGVGVGHWLTLIFSMIVASTYVIFRKLKWL